MSDDFDFAELPTAEAPALASVMTDARGQVKPPRELPRFRPLSAIINDLTGTQWLVKPILERDALAGWFGDSGSFKSFVALDVGLSVAYGRNWHDLPTHRGAVFYICGEGAGGVGRRIEAWRIHHGIKDTDAPFFVSELPAQFIEEDNAKAIANAVDALAKQAGHDPVLVIVDTLSTNFGAGDESSNPDMAQLMANLNVSIRHRFNCAVVIVHHTGHGNKDRARGASAFRANLDSSIKIARQSEKMTTALHCDKQKDAPDFDPIALKAVVVRIPDLYDSEGEPQSSLALDLTEYHESTPAGDLNKRQKHALTTLFKLYDEHADRLTAGGASSLPRVEVTEWRDACTDIPRNRFHDTKKQLIQHNLIRVEGVFAFPIDVDPDGDPDNPDASEVPL